MGEYTKNYFKRFGKLYSIGTLISGGSFCTLGLLNSNWIGVIFFQCGLSQKQMEKYASHKILLTTFLENVPQLIIQSICIWKLEIITFTVIIASLSSVFNILLSIMSTIISRVTHKNQKEIPLTINLSWIIKEERVTVLDPFSKVGKRECLEETLRSMNTDDHPFDFEILSSNK